MVTELKREKLAVQCKARRCYETAEKAKCKKNFGASQELDWHYMPPCTTEAIPLKDIDMIMK